MIQIQREAERRRRADLEERRRAQVEWQRAQGALEKARAADEKEPKRLYLEARSAEVDARNEGLKHRVDELERILRDTVDVDIFLDFESLGHATPNRPSPLVRSQFR